MADVISRVVITAVDQTAGAFAGAERSISGLAGKTDELSSISRVAGSALGAIGVSFSIAGAVGALQQIGSALISAEAQSAKFRATFTSIAGADSVGREMEFVRVTARQLGLDLDATATSYAKLAASSRGTALEGQATRDIFTAVSRAATALGLSTAETDGALLAISQMMSKGTVSAEELRGQLGERLPGAFNIAAKAMGVSTAELGKMLETGQVLAEDFIPKFTRALEEVGATAATTAGTSAKEFQRLKNEFQELWKVIADAGAATAIANVFRSIQQSIAGVSERIRLLRAENGGSLGFGGVLRLLDDDGRGTAQARYDAAEAKLRAGNLGMYERSQVVLERDAALADLQRVRNLNATQIGGQQEGGADDAERLAAMEAERKKVEELTTWYRNFNRDLSGQHKDYQANLSKLAELRARGIIQEGEYTERVKDLIKEQGGVKDALGARSRAEQEAERQAKKLTDAYFEALGINRDYSEKVRELETLYRQKRLTTDEYTAAVRRLAGEQPVVRENAKREEEAQRQATAADKERQVVIAQLTKMRQEAATAIGKELAEAEKNLAATREEISQIGLTKEQLANLTAQRVEEKAALVEQRIEQNGVVVATGEEYDALVALARKYREHAAEIRGGARLSAIADEAAKSKEAWTRQAGEIERSLTDALLRGFEGGKNFAQNLVATLKNMFGTLVLKPIIQAVVNPIAGTITAALGLPGTAAASGGMQAISAASGLGSLTSMASSFGGSIASLFGSGAATAAGVEGATALAIGAEASAVAGIAGGSGIAGTLAAIPGWGWAIAGLAALAGVLSKKRGGPKLGGSFDTGGVFGERLYTPSTADAEVSRLGSGVLQSIGDLAKELGGTGAQLGLALGFDTDPQGTASNRISSLLKTAGGQSLFSSINREVGRDDARLQGELANETARLVLAGLQASDLPAAVREYLSKVDIASFTAGQLDSVISGAKALLPQAEQSLLDKALADPGTYTAVSTEVRELVTITGDHVRIAKEQQEASLAFFQAATAAYTRLIELEEKVSAGVQRLADAATMTSVRPA